MVISWTIIPYLDRFQVDQSPVFVATIDSSSITILNLYVCYEFEDDNFAIFVKKEHSIIPLVLNTACLFVPCMVCMMFYSLVCANSTTCTFCIQQSPDWLQLEVYMYTKGTCTIKNILLETRKAGYISQFIC